MHVITRLFARLSGDLHFSCQQSATLLGNKLETRKYTPHDAAYKRFFSDPLMVESLLRDFVPEHFVDDLDFSTLELCSGDYVTDDLSQGITTLSGVSVGRTRSGSISCFFWNSRANRIPGCH